MLYSSDPNDLALSNLEKAKKEFESDLDDADNIIGYGRRIGYTGDYREAIRCFVRLERVFEPDPDRHAVYQARLRKYDELFPLLRTYLASLESAPATG